MKNKIIQFIIPILLLGSLAVLTYHRWLSFDTFTSGDWWYFTRFTMEEYFPLSIWYALFGFGSIDITLWRVPVINIPFGIFANLGYGQEVAEKLTVFWPSIIIGNVAMFLLAKKIFKSNTPSVISTIVFNYNTYYLVSTHLLLYSAAAWGVLCLYFFMQAIEYKKVHFAILSGLALFITAAYDLRATYIIIIILAIHYLFLFYLSTNNIKKFLFSTLPYAGLPVLVFILLNTYWVLPLINASSLGSNDVLARPLFGNEFLNVLYAITLYHPFWTGSYSAIFENQSIVLYFWLIPLAALSGLILNRRNPHILFFGFVALLGILLTKQVGAPFTDLYKFLFENVPGFSAFREASKFYFLIVLGYAILIGGLVDWLLKHYCKSNEQRIIRNIVVALIALLFLWNIKPYITGEIGSMYVSRTIPNGYQTLNTFLLDQKGYSRTLWYPIFTRWGVNTYSHPALSSVEMILIWDEYIKQDLDAKTYTSGELALRLLSKKNSDTLLDYASIGYIIVPPQEERREDFFLDYGIKREVYIQELDKIDFLDRVNIGTDAFAVYKNNNFRPQFYITQKEISIENNADYNSWEDVEGKQISPSEYKLTIRNVKEPFYLHFSENYHPEWKARIGDVDWVSVITQNGYFLPDNVHFKNEMMFNSYNLNPVTICNDNKYCQKNKDGSYDIVMTIYFRPQAFLYLGGIFSGTVLILLLGYLTYIFTKNIKYGKKK